MYMSLNAESSAWGLPLLSRSRVREIVGAAEASADRVGWVVVGRSKPDGAGSLKKAWMIPRARCQQAHCGRGPDVARQSSGKCRASRFVLWRRGCVSNCEHWRDVDAHLRIGRLRAA